MKIKKSLNYIVGVCSITQMTDKERKLKYDNGEVIEVSEEEYNKINKFNWAEVVNE